MCSCRVNTDHYHINICMLHLVASEIPGRTGQQCMHRWQKALMPGIRKGRWTAEEDEVRRFSCCIVTTSLHTATETSCGNVWGW